jgi:hypothetical protein
MKSCCAASYTHLRHKIENKRKMKALGHRACKAWASGSCSSAILNNNKEVPARRIDVDVALHASASYYCGFLRESFNKSMSTMQAAVTEFWTE